MDASKPLPNLPAEDGTIDPEKTKPLEWKDRLLLQFVFDTQPKKREAFLKQRGWEMDPKNHDQIRPIGYTGGYQWEVDPGGLLNVKQYYKDGNWLDGASELGKDATEMAIDFLIGAGIEGVGDAAAVGLGVPTAGLGAVGARSLGRASAFQALERIKDQAADFIVGEKLPTDEALRTLQTTVQSIGPEALAKGGKYAAKGAGVAFKKVSEGVRNLLKIGNGSISDYAWERLKANPEIYASYEAVSEGRRSLQGQLNKLFGIPAGEGGIPDKIMPGSLFQNKLNALESRRQAEAQTLSQNPEAAMPLSDLIKRLEARLYELKSLPKNKQDEDGIGWLSKKISDLKDDYLGQKASVPGRFEIKAPKVEPTGVIGNDGNEVLQTTKLSPKDVLLSFGEVDKIVKKMQDDIYYNAPTRGDWRTVVKSVVDGYDGKPGLNDMLKNRAADLGSNYAAVKEAESKVFKAFEMASQNISRDNVASSIIGSKTKTGTRREDVEDLLTPTFQAIDEALGTKIFPAIQSDQVKTEIFKTIEGSYSRGSGGGLMGAAAAALPLIASGHNKAAAIAAPLGYMAGDRRFGTRLAIGANNVGDAMGQLASRMDNPANLLAKVLQGQSIGMGDAAQAVARAGANAAIMSTQAPQERATQFIGDKINTIPNASAAESNPYLKGIDLTDEDKSNPYLHGADLTDEDQSNPYLKGL